MENRPVTEQEVARVAADWWTRLRDPQPSAEVLARWQAWMEADARHAQAFEQLNALGETLRAAPAPQRQELLDEFAPRAVRPWSRPYVLAAAAVLLALLGGWGLRLALDRAPPAQRYASPVGEDREIRLPDGTDIALGAASSMTTRYDASRRDVALAAGEAYFTVRHEQRPFVVDAGPLRIEDLGTAFNVRRTGQRVSVAVTEGRVRVSPAGAGTAGPLELVAGQQAEYDPHGGALRVSQLAAGEATAWRRHQLQFVNEPLAMVIANVNRYSRRPVQLADPRLGRLLFTGTVNTTNIDGWIGALPHVFPLQVSRFADHVVLSGTGH